MSWADHLTGAGVGGGLVGLITVVARLVGRDRSEERKAALQAAKVEAEREETGTHATERAFAAVKQLLDEERQARRKEGEGLRLEIEALRLENEELRHLLDEERAQRRTERDELMAVVNELRTEMLRSYVKSDPPRADVVIGRMKKG